MENIASGDTVRHKTYIHLNGGVAFGVREVDGDKALCNFFDEKGDHREEWFNLSDLILVAKSEGGFLDLH